MQVKISLCLPRDAETVSLVRSAITNALLMFGVTAECAEEIRLAVSEACTNVILHAASDDEYEVVVAVDEENCSISVSNTGGTFDAASLEGVMPSPESAQGRGVAIMKAVMDSVQLASSPESGTIVNLVTAISAREDGPLWRLQRKDQRGPRGRPARTDGASLPRHRVRTSRIRGR